MRKLFKLDEQGKAEFVGELTGQGVDAATAAQEWRYETAVSFKAKDYLERLRNANENGPAYLAREAIEIGLESYRANRNDDATDLALAAFASGDSIESVAIEMD
jgi:hypothetical protein